MIIHKHEITDNRENRYILLIAPYGIQITTLYHIKFKQLSHICISKHREHNHIKLQQNSSKFQNPAFIIEFPTYRVLPRGSTILIIYDRPIPMKSKYPT